ncbi:MAG: PIN domain-containing protein [Balneolaceae bacterium]|nr:PIN domain-containing protein [Balneolaceae bacterium]
MNVLFDSSALVALLVKDHDDHQRVYQLYKEYADRETDLFISTHSIAEVFRTLTWGVEYLNYSANEAHQAIHYSILSVFETVDSTKTDYRLVLEFLRQNNLKGPIIYDALIAFASEKVRAKELVTLNTKDFRRVWGLTSANLVEP